MLITHMQYFIIITKLGINYPAVITKYQSILSALTGTENYIAFSPSCLFNNADSAGQAVSQIAFGLASPCMAVFVTLVIWAVRYMVANQSLLRRVNAGRWNNSKALHDLVFPPDLADPQNSIAPEVRLSSPGSKASEARNANRLGKPRGSILSVAGLRIAMSSEPPKAGGECIAAAASLPHAQAPIVFAGLGMEPKAHRPTAPAGAYAYAQQPFQGALSPLAQAAAAPPSGPAAIVVADGKPPAATPLTPSTNPVMTTTTPFEDKPIVHLVASSGNGKSEISIQVDEAVGSEGPSAAAGIRLPQAASSSADVKVQLVQRPHKGKSQVIAHGPVALVRQSSSRRFFARQQQQQQQQQQLAKASIGSGVPFQPAAGGHLPSSPPNVCMAGAFINGEPNVDGNPWSHTPFAAGPPPDENDDDSPGNSVGGKAASWPAVLLQRVARPFQLLVFADQAVSLRQQLEIALSIFACYKLDPGTGVFAENQQATWPLGYWVRNMQQECYAGVHRRVYVPIGIASALLFCFCPPIAYFLLTFKSRRKFEEPRIKIQYGFLYQQYKYVSCDIKRRMSVVSV
ncbi:hypothetical protein PLESTB_000154700 [Pleodorina starrii]|uniref:Uncharacterized protein n=1 Tax=Pleodorina starrii TaxID=330485 RepID=A0A9W6BBR4_9CHLO|nr:hypothetical protein PLESTB_000154700 [Pleodorina starrii]